MSYINKILEFTLALNKAGVVFDPEDGDTAIICDDCVVILTKSGEDVGFTVVDKVKRFPYSVNLTDSDYDGFISEAESYNRKNLYLN